MPTNNNHTPEQEEYTRLIRDLRAMPRVQAPSNFEYLLQQQILGSEKPEESWWKRFFLSGFNIAGFRVPVYAYGPVAAALIVFLGIYVFNATNFESQLPDLEADQTLPQQESLQQPQQDPQSQPPQVAVPDEATEVSPSPRKNEGQETPTPPRQPSTPQVTPSGPSPRSMVPPPVVPPAVVAPSRTAPGADASGRGESDSDDEMMLPKTRGLPDAQKADEESNKPMQMRDKIDGRSEKAGAAMERQRNEIESKLKKESEPLLESRSQYLIMGFTSRKDSLRRLDSLRRVDSLRNLKTK